VSRLRVSSGGSAVLRVPCAVAITLVIGLRKLVSSRMTIDRIVEVCAETDRDIFGDIGDVAGSWWDDPLNFGDPGDMATSAQHYWVQSDSWVAGPAGSAVSMVDAYVNPDRLDNYIKNNPWAGSETLGDCIGGVRVGRPIGGAAGAVVGFGLGAASGSELGLPGALGVGAVSGAAGYGIGSSTGSTIGCGVGVASGL